MTRPLERDPRPLQRGNVGRIDDAELWHRMMRAQRDEGRLWRTISEVARLDRFGIEATRRSLGRLMRRGTVARRWVSDRNGGRYYYSATGYAP